MRTLKEIEIEMDKLCSERYEILQQEQIKAKNDTIYQDIIKIEKQLENFQHIIYLPIELKWTNVNNNYYTFYNNISTIEDNIDLYDIDTVIKLTPTTDTNMTKLKLIQTYNKLCERFYQKYGYSHHHLKRNVS